MLLRHLVKVGPLLQQFAHFAKLVIRRLAFFAPFWSLENMRRPHFLFGHEPVDMLVIKLKQVGVGCDDVGTHLIHEPFDAQVGFHVMSNEVHMRGRGAGGGIKLHFPAVLLDYLGDSRVHVRLGRRLKLPLGFLGKQHAGDDVLAGIAAKFLVALAARDIAEPFEVSLDLAKF